MSCIQPNVSSFVNFRCVLCYKIPSTKCDINFVKEDVKTELEDVSVILAAVLKCICKLCLSLVKKRKGLREKLLELDANIRRIHKANFSSTNPRPAVAKGLEYEPKVNTNNVGKIIIGGFVMKELSKDPPRVLLTYITHVDLAGSVPSRIVNKVTANQPLSVGIVKQCVEKMYQEMLDNPDGSSEFKTKAMTYLGKLERAKNMMQNAKIAETSEVPVEQEPAQAASESVMNGGIRRSESLPRQSPRGIHSSSSVPQFHSPKMKFSSCDDVHIDYKTIGNQACAGLLQEVFEVAEVDITKTVGSSGTVSEQWEYRGTEKEVMMFRKVHANEKMHSFIGKGIMPCSPPRVWEVLKEPKHRYQYDNMLKETRVLEKINDSIIIQYLHFEAANCFKKQSRDFIALRTARKEKDKYLISFVSVDYRDCPEKKDIKRGKIIASGWVVEPLLHNGQLFSMVTYLAQFNPGGSYPVSLVNFVARKQPLCVAYLKKYLENPNIAQTDFSDSS